MKSPPNIVVDNVLNNIKAIDMKYAAEAFESSPKFTEQDEFDIA